MKKKILAVILIAKSGGGKGTIAQALLKLDAMHSKKLALSVSDTTRPQKNGDIDGVHYNFISVDEFNVRARFNNHYLEWERYAGNLYGSPKDQFVRNCEAGLITLYDIDPKGAKKIIEKLGKDVVEVFYLVVPNEDLIERAKNRGRDTEDEQLLRKEEDEKRFDDSLLSFVTVIPYANGAVPDVVANEIYNAIF